MPRSRPVKRLSDGELAELRAQPIDLLDRGWIQHSTAGRAASVVSPRKSESDGPWRICYDYRGSRSLTKLDLAGSYHQLLDAGRGPRTGGRRASRRGWATSSGAWCRLVCRGPPPR